MTETEYTLLRNAKTASRQLARTTAEQRSLGLQLIADVLEEDLQLILQANRLDLEWAAKTGLSAQRTGILTINEGAVRGMIDFFRQASHYADPVGRLLSMEYKPNGLRREKRLFPLGVIAVCYEARPSVVTDCMALCLRSGNALLLCSSRHAMHTDTAMTAAIRRGLERAGLPAEAITLLPGGDHALTYEAAQQDRLVDLMIVRGGYKAVRDIKAQATVPVIAAGPGNCHIFIDASAKADMALKIVHNSKVPRPLACNAAETILVHKDWPAEYLDKLVGMLTENGIALRGDAALCKRYPHIPEVTEKDLAEEFFASVIAICQVDSLDSAIEHICRYYTPHTECIITEAAANAARFMAEVPANVVCHNASTRLTDGMEFGLGGEMGISTQKYPYGGPIGPEHLMQQKYYLAGPGITR